MCSAKVVLSRRLEIPRDVTMLIGSITFTLLITIGAFVYIPLPFTPVPITLQVLFVLLAGLILDGRYGTFSSLIYVVLGVTGLPVFAGAVGGISRIFGPTGGYIIGFLIAPSIVSYLYKITGKRNFSAFLAMCAGLSVIYLFGILHLSIFLEYRLGNAFKIGVLPFILGDSFKIILAYLFVRISRRQIWNS